MNLQFAHICTVPDVVPLWDLFNPWWKHLQTSGRKESSIGALTSYLPSGIALILYYRVQRGPKKLKQGGNGNCPFQSRLQRKLAKYRKGAHNGHFKSLPSACFKIRKDMIKVKWEIRDPGPLLSHWSRRAYTSGNASIWGKWLISFLYGAVQFSAALFIPLWLCHCICVYLYASGIEYRVNSDGTLHLLDLCNPVCASCHRAREPWVASVTHAMCIL